MTDIARMRFQSAKNPGESGWLAIDSFGNMRVEPSDEMIEAVAHLEQDAVEGSQRNTRFAASVFFCLACAVGVLGWFVGRVTGRLRERLTTPRDVKTTPLEFDSSIGLRVTLSDGPLQTAQLSWSPGEYNLDEAEQFVETYQRIRAAKPEDA